MSTACRTWWRNCASRVDAEIQAIDEREDSIAPLDGNIVKIRELISSVELCHHKAKRWVRNIVEAIGTGDTEKGLGTRRPGKVHPRERVWQCACDVLSEWCAGRPASSLDLLIGDTPAPELVSGLGDWSPLRAWQVQRVIEKIRSTIGWPPSSDGPTNEYHWLMLSGGEYESMYRTECPEHYKQQEEYWLATVRTIINDSVGGEAIGLSLAIAIDMLWPCHWNFIGNLRLVLEAIGGVLNPSSPFMACGRNIEMLPSRPQMTVAADTLDAFSDPGSLNPDGDRELLSLLGEPTEVKRWLAASLAKTIRLQLNPSAEMRALSELRAPDWVRS